MPIEDADYFIRVVKFPVPICACLSLNPDGTYSLYLNADMDFEHWLDGWEHEMNHIIRDDLFGDKAIEEVESI